MSSSKCNQETQQILLESKRKQDAEFKQRYTLAPEEPRHTEQSPPRGGENMLVVLFGLGPVHLHPALMVKKKKRINACSNKLRNYIQIYSTKIMHL